MKAKEAAEIIKRKNEDFVIIDCLEFDDFFAFALTEKGRENELFGGGYDTVSKKDGSTSTFNPVQDFDKFFAAKHIDINSLI